MRTHVDPAPILARQQGRSDVAYARFLGIDRQTLRRWRAGEVAQVNEAGRIAERLGLHPDELWPETTDRNWFARAACAGMDTELFFPERGESTKEAKAVCASCPVQTDCLEWVLTNFRSGDDHGVWAGTSVRERRAMRHGARLEDVAS